VVKSNVAIVGPRVRFPAGAILFYFFNSYLSLLLFFNIFVSKNKKAILRAVTSNTDN
jgi:hypothetical protein